MAQHTETQSIESQAAIKRYLAELKQALNGQDPALIQDVLFDTEQHFMDAIIDQPTHEIETVIADYGSPEEIARYYCDIEEKVTIAFHGKQIVKPPQTTSAFWQVFKDPGAYRAILFNLISLPLGLAYFAWTVFGGTISLTTSLFVVGLPLLLIYLKSMQYFSLFEGKLAEALLNVRMPRRPAAVDSPQHMSVKARILGFVRQRQLWTATIYMAVKFPLAFFAFMTTVIPMMFGVALVISPIVDPIVHSINPAIDIDIQWYMFPISIPAGIGLMLLTLKYSMWLAAFQGKLAKIMLVKR